MKVSLPMSAVPPGAQGGRLCSQRSWPKWPGWLHRQGSTVRGQTGGPESRELLSHRDASIDTQQEPHRGVPGHRQWAGMAECQCLCGLISIHIQGGLGEIRFTELFQPGMGSIMGSFLPIYVPENKTKKETNWALNVE